MRFNETTIQYAYPHRVRNVGSVALERQTKDKSLINLNRLFLVVEYVGFIMTFYALIVIRVMPRFKHVDRYNPIDWANHLPIFRNYVLFLFVFLVLYAIAIVQRQLFSGRADRSTFEQFMLNLRSLIYAYLLTIGITFLLKTTFLYSRVTITVFIVLVLIESLIWLCLKRILLHRLYRKGRVKSHVLIIGAGRIGMELYNQFTTTQGKKVNVVGLLDDHKEEDHVLGKIAELERIIQNNRIDVIYITIPSERHVIESMLHTIYKYDVDIRIIPEMFDRMATVFAFRNDLEMPCLQIVKTPLRGMNVVLKRIVDIVSSVILLIILSPLFVAIAIGIKIDTRGKVFFRQLRVGKNGVPFHMLKFRSMREDAEQAKRKLKRVNEANGPVFKIRNDPRVTRIGQYLRRYSLDELPQLWNVLKGQMSLIGPRPPLPSEVEQYTDYHWRRMDVLPGMTGLWQVSGRSDLKFEEWIDLDIYYIERWSFVLEMKIVLKTIPAVIKGSGAY